MAESRIDRRELLKLGAAGMGLVALGPWAGRRVQKLGAEPLQGTKRLVVVNLVGGNDGLNTLVNTNLSSYYERRPTLALRADQTLSIPGTTYERLHPSLTNLQQLYRDGDLAFVNKVGYPDANLSHDVSGEIWSLGQRNDRATAGGWAARFADLYTDGPLGVVSMGLGRRRDFAGGEKEAFVVKKLSRFDFQPDWQYRKNHALRIDKVRNILELESQGNTLEEEAARRASGQAHELSTRIAAAVESFESVGTYADDTFSRRLRDVACLIDAGFETKIYYTGFTGFDVHADQLERHAELLGSLDQGLAGFSEDLKAQGVWDDTLILVISEFGRKCRENGSLGTDHGHGNTLMLLGGAVEGGIYGSSLSNADLDELYLDYETDFRTVYSQIFERHFGADPARIFSEQPLKAGNPGQLIA